MYKYYRSTPLVRAYGLEKALGTPAHIYFKNESVSPMGSHKLNSAIPKLIIARKKELPTLPLKPVPDNGGLRWLTLPAYLDWKLPFTK
jgi:predicted alternative tryptophan synthase beta-subunit